ncbi:hypothetical protein [Vallitalea okinawensis]|uniref:hypothetical protein n=1 Tax=Vallitalea okinawensis TaxID=2078660 RepID=UPI000CFC3919|nr:hypothetical protein [Vallitalea okinawensis]
MKKIMFLVLLMSFLLTACSSENAEDTASTATHRFTGEVTEIMGNEVTVEGMTMNLQEMEERKAQFQEGGEQINRENAENMDQENRGQGAGRNIQTETLVTTIPIGINIVELQYDDEGNAIEGEASLSDIKKGKRIIISYNESIDNIVHVSIIDNENMQQGMGGLGGMRGMMGGGGGKR